MKKYVYADEEWPVYSLIDHGTRYDMVVELSDEEWADYERVEREYEAWQLKLRKVYRKSVEAFDD